MPAQRRTGHLNVLRENRARRFESNLKPLLTAQGAAVAGMRQRFFQDVALVQNRARGGLFELIGEHLLVNHLRRQGVPGESLRKQVRFDTPDGIRIADFLCTATGTIYEMESGYLIWNRSARMQAGKDAWLLAQGREVRQAVWFLFRGGSAKALVGLTAAGIGHLDLGFGIPSDDAGPVTVIRV